MKTPSILSIITAAITVLPVAAQADVSISQPAWSLASGVDPSGWSADFTKQSLSFDQGQAMRPRISEDDFVAWGGESRKRHHKKSR
jgi:hypothetical protein